MLISIRRSIIRLSTGWRSTLLIRNKAQTIRLRTSNGKLFKWGMSGNIFIHIWRGRQGRDHMVVRFKTTCAISAHLH